ncbi:MAG: DUF1501 domain-containing protein [Phycisphaeraceae bacterium]
MDEHQLQQTRRTFLRSGAGVGSIALATLLNPSLLRAGSADSGESAWGGVANPPHLLPKAKRVIFLYMSGGPSHLETFDYKPMLQKYSGKPMPESYTKGEPIAQLQGQDLRCLGPMAKFKRYGQSGQMISDFLPHHHRIADDIAIIRSMHTEQINHDPAHTVMNTGVAISGRPSWGSWVLYGLGSESQNLPGFVVLSSHSGRSPQPISTRMWHSGFLPGRFQGVKFQSHGDPIHYVSNPPGVTQQGQRRLLDTVGALNRARDEQVDSQALRTRISQYELAFRMQSSVPDLMDLSDEPSHVFDMYGCQPGDGTFASNCLLARRLSERGVRFVQLYHRGWDHHNNIKGYMDVSARSTDQPAAALVADLKQRGLLDETLVIWGGEFGRTPMAQGAINDRVGRDHHIRGFSMWMAGGGIRGGVTHGSTDEMGYDAIEKPTHVHDLHATAMHLMGINHKRLTYRYQGRDFRLTDVFGKVAHEIIA